MPSLPRIGLYTSELSPGPVVSFLLGVVAGAAACSLCLLLRNRRDKRGSSKYESSSQLNEYLCFHYATEKELDFPELLPANGLQFPLRCARVCLDFSSHKGRALDLGCAVGRSSFELAREFAEVLAVDFSQSFIDAGTQLASEGEIRYVIPEEGLCGRDATAAVDSAIDRSRVKFLRADATNLPSGIGTFDCILAGNLICRLENPLALLTKVSSLLNPNGVLVLTTPFYWSSVFTEKSRWLGGTKSSPDSFTELQRVLETSFELLERTDMPFLIRETRRKHQWTVALCSVWRIK